MKDLWGEGIFTNIYNGKSCSIVKGKEPIFDLFFFQFLLSVVALRMYFTDLQLQAT